MSGSMMMGTGVVLIVLSTAGMIFGEFLLHRKKKQIREQIYHIYD